MAEFLSTQLVIQKNGKDDKGKPARIEIGKLDIFVPSLAEIAKACLSDVKKNEKGETEMNEGLPVYVDDKANWVMTAILDAVKADAKSKISIIEKEIDGKKIDEMVFKEGAKISTNWEELCAESPRNQGAALKLLREFREAFAEWVKKQGIKEAAANTLIALATTKTSLITQTAETKAKVKARLEGFAASLDEETANKFERPFTVAFETCEAVADNDF